LLFRKPHSYLLPLAMFAIACLCFRLPARAQRNVDPWSAIEAKVARRNFFGLTAIDEKKDVMHALNSDPGIAAVRDRRRQVLEQAVNDCHDAPCFDQALRWSEDDLAAVSSRLRVLYAKNPEARAFTEKVLRSSGRFALSEKLAGADLLSTVWTNAALGINRIIAVYGEGAPPHYARIDSMRYDPKSPEYAQLLHAIVAMIESEDDSRQSFFYPSMKYAVMLLASNDRLDAGRYEPLATTENAAAIRRTKTIDWKRYPYTILVVPGEGPEQPDVALSPLGRVRVEQAVRLYRARKAPFLLVSGGTVHPMLTHFNEAMEMREELMTQWGVPKDAIFVDPYARHTTTNLRNAVREVLRYGIPADKPMLITSDAGQSVMIISPAFTRRCRDEMHLLPWKTLKPVSSTQAEMFPSRDSLQEDPVDPMDP
jgi:hypothetical protein